MKDIENIVPAEKTGSYEEYTKRIEVLLAYLDSGYPQDLYKQLEDSKKETSSYVGKDSPELKEIKDILMQCLGMKPKVQQRGFDYSEHVCIGEALVDCIKGHLKDEPVLKEGKIISFGGFEWDMAKLCALGDFFEPYYPISSTTNKEEQTNRFLEGFDSICKADAQILKGVLFVGAVEETAVVLARKNAVPIDTAIHAVASKVNKAWSNVIGVRYVVALANNLDHFTPNNEIAYRIAHEAAKHELRGLKELIKKCSSLKKNSKNVTSERKTSIEKIENEIQQKIRKCVWKELYGQHYLNDMFSAGHVRVPREEIYNIPKTVPEETGFLVHYMHNEDSQYGVLVEDKAHNSWITMGDSQLRTKNDTLTYALKATQTGVEELIGLILQAYGKETKLPKFGEVYKLFPKEKFTKSPNCFPVFKMDKDEEGRRTLLRREDVIEPKCKTYISNWTIAGTWAILKWHGKLPIFLPGSKQPTLEKLSNDELELIRSKELEKNKSGAKFIFERGGFAKKIIPEDKTVLEKGNISQEITFGFMSKKLKHPVIQTKEKPQLTSYVKK